MFGINGSISVLKLIVWFSVTSVYAIVIFDLLSKLLVITTLFVITLFIVVLLFGATDAVCVALLLSK